MFEGDGMGFFVDGDTCWNNVAVEKDVRGIEALQGHFEIMNIRDLDPGSGASRSRRKTVELRRLVTGIGGSSEGQEEENGQKGDDPGKKTNQGEVPHETLRIIL